MFFSRYWGRKIEKGGALDSLILGGVPEIENALGGDSSPKPEKFSLREKMPEVGLQENYDCVGWAGAYLSEFLNHEETGKWTDLSGMYIYRRAKELDGFNFKGTYISHATYIPTRFGVAEEEDYPEKKLVNDPVDLPVPSLLAERDAKKYKAKESVRVIRGGFGNVDGIKDALWQWKRPIIVGAGWFENTYPDRKGRLPLPKGSERFGHAVAACGYDDETGLLEFINSFGYNWGDSGYGYFPYDYSIYSTCWTMIDEKNVVVEPTPAVVSTNERNIESEQRNAAVLRDLLYQVFPDNSRPEKALAGRYWIRMINAMTYLGYSALDMLKFLVEAARGHGELYELSKPKESTA